MPTVLITGANRGFGLEIFKIYSLKGWKTFPLVRSKNDADRLKTNYPDNCFPIIADVFSDDVIEIIESELKRHADKLDLLINNAGTIVKNRGFEKTSAKDLMDHLNVHCAGVLRCVKGSLHFLKRSNRPAIINVTSRWGSIARTVEGQGGLTGLIYSYKIAKAAQNMLTVCLDQDLKKYNIRVFAVHPGRLKTDAAPADADTDPKEAAAKIYDWIQNIKDDDCRFHDLMKDETIKW